jgi:PTS system mannose-specific IIA component
VIGVLVVTHGRLAAELVSAAETIAGAQPNLRALALDWREGLDVARGRIASEIATLPSDEGVLILTDMFGDTPTNAALGFVAPGRVEVISGVNLPMVVRLACVGGSRGSLAETARWLEVKARRAIRRASSVERGPLPESAPADEPCDG